MPMSKDDRIAISLKIVSADAEIKGLELAKASIAAEIVKAQKLDEANKNLFDPFNALINSYQLEFATLDGLVRTLITEQDQIDAAGKKIQNHFFPNDTTIVVPSLSAFHNIWVQTKPFALTYLIGKNYTEQYGATTKESDLISAVQAFITSAGSNTDIQNTTGQSCNASGTCSIPMYTTQATCIAAMPTPGIWTPGPDLIANDPAIQTLKTDLVGAVNTLKTFLLAEVATIPTSDSNATRQAQNNTAISNINTVIIPAINTWLAYVDFNIAHGQTTCIGFNAYNSNLLAPTKLHSSQLSVLQSALTARSSFVTTRQAQVNANLGTITQDLTNGNLLTSTGLYGQRFGFLNLRLDIFNGSLTKLIALQTTSGAQDSIKASILSAKAAYMSILPTSIFKAPGNGTAMITLVDTSFLSPGDSVFVMAEGQEELIRAIKSVSGNDVVLNDTIPAKYRPAEKARLYKDLS